MVWRCEGICGDCYFDDDPVRTLPTGERVCPSCLNRPLREVYDLTRNTMGDAIVLFRRIDGGEFYEAFEDDAETVARVLNLKTTFIGNTWLVSFAAEFLEPYLAKLIGAGHRVALCERDRQTEHERFLLRNATVKPKESSVFTPLPKARQKPLLRGLQDSPGQMNLFPGMDVA